MNREKEPRYYHIRASIFWSSIVAVGLMCILVFSLNFYVGTETESTEHKTSKRVEYGTIISQLKNSDECYLCGNSNLSLMGYYRKFDTVGIIGLNEWYVLDLRLKEYDENGDEMVQQDHSKTLFGNSQGVDYYVNSTPSRGMATATISSDNGIFDEKIIRQNLCQNCLDKVTDTLETYCEVETQEEYVPFCIVDFETLKLYPLQKQNRGYFVRDYWVDIEQKGEEIEIQVFYLPGYK